MDRVTSDQIELLKKYYDLDEKRKVFDVVLHYEKASELFDTDVESKAPKMKNEVVAKIVDIVEDIPHGYKADISLVIDDYEGYDKEAILESFNDLLYLTRYRFNRENKSKWLAVGVLILVGVMLLFLKSLMDVNSFWGMLDTSEIAQSVILSITEIAGWVFIWESVSLLFLRRSDILRLGTTMLSKIANIELYRGDEEKALAKESTKEIARDLINNDLDRRIGMTLLLFAGLATIGVGFASLLSAISGFKPDAEYAVINLISSIISVLIKLLVGFVAVQLYRGKEKYLIPVIIVGALDFCILVLRFIAIALGGVEIGNLIMVILSLVINIAYVVGVVLYLVGSARQKRKVRELNAVK